MGKIVEHENLGYHIPIKSLSAEKLISAIKKVQSPDIKAKVMLMGQKIRDENGLDNAIYEIEKYLLTKNN